VRLWDISTGKPKEFYSAPTKRISSLPPNGNTLVSQRSKASILARRSAGGELHYDFAVDESFPIAFSPDGAQHDQ
jgi:WD40 repeat protein